MKPFVLAISLLFSTILASGQDILTGVQATFATFNMSGLKDMNTEVLRSLPFDAKTTVSFPANFGFKAYMGQYAGTKVFIALKYSMNSTGSLISRSDYSGSYGFKMRTHYHSPGVLVHIKMFSFSRYRIWFCTETGYNFSSLELRETMKTAGNSNEEITDYRSTNFYFEPGLKTNYPLNSFFSVEAYAGYTFDVMGGLKLKDDFDIKELIDIGHHAGYTINWSGIRIGLGITVRIPDI